MTVQQPTDDTRADLIAKTRRADFVQGLHDVADWLDRNDDVPIDNLGVNVDLFTQDFAVFQALLKRDDVTASSVGKYIEVSHVFAGNVGYVLNYSQPDEQEVKLCKCGAPLYGTLRVHHCTD